MADRPIIFSAPMVRALLAGRKTQTRRILKPQPFIDRMGNFCAPNKGGGHSNWGQHIDGRPCTQNFLQTLRFKVGDRLWVRETWKPHSIYQDAKPRDVPPLSRIFYRADDTYAPSNTPWRSPIHMPRWASRITLAVSALRVQRLQDLGEDDARAEGMQEPTLREVGGALAQAAWSERQVFRRFWDRLHHGVHAWDANPWVAAITFTVARQNIDAPRHKENSHA